MFNKIICTLLFCCTLHSLEAQVWNAQTISDYNEIRIKIADKDGDDEIQHNEVIRHREMMFYYFNQVNFVKQDVNKSRGLNQRELTQAFTDEQRFLNSLWMNQLKKLTKTYGTKQLSNLTFLKRNIGVLKQLLQNTIWLKTNDTLIEEMLNDNEWAEKHKSILRTFTNNYHYFMQNVNKAMRWYKLPNVKEIATPQFSLMRQLHLKAINRNPKLKKFL